METCVSGAILITYQRRCSEVSALPSPRGTIQWDASRGSIININHPSKDFKPCQVELAGNQRRDWARHESLALRIPFLGIPVHSHWNDLFGNSLVRKELITAYLAPSTRRYCALGTPMQVHQDVPVRGCVVLLDAFHTANRWSAKNALNLSCTMKQDQDWYIRQTSLANSEASNIILGTGCLTMISFSLACLHELG